MESIRIQIPIKFRQLWKSDPAPGSRNLSGNRPQADAERRLC